MSEQPVVTNSEAIPFPTTAPGDVLAPTVILPSPTVVGECTATQNLLQNLTSMSSMSELSEISELIVESFVQVHVF